MKFPGVNPASMAIMSLGDRNASAALSYCESSRKEQNFANIGLNSG